MQQQQGRGWVGARVRQVAGLYRWAETGTYRLASGMEDASKRHHARGCRVAVDAVHGDRVVTAIGCDDEICTHMSRMRLRRMHT